MKKLTTNEKLDVLLELALDNEDKETIIDVVRNNRSSLQVEHGFTHKLLTIIAVSAVVGAVSIVVLVSYVVG